MAVDRVQVEPTADTDWSRWGGISGILFAVLFTMSLFLWNLPVGGGSSTDEVIRAYYADEGNRTRLVVATYVLAVAGLAFSLFLAALYSTLRVVESAPRFLSLVVLISGAVFVAMLMSAGAAIGALASGMSLGGEPATLGDTGVARFLGHMGYLFVLLYGAFAAIALMVATSLVTLRTAVFPRWLAWAGFVAAVLLLAGIIFLPMLAFPLWVLGASVRLMQRRQAVPA